MIKQAAELHTALDNIAVSEKDLQSLALTNLEWEQINEIMEFLEV